MTGRPSSYTDQIAAEICERLVAGDSLRTICAADDMPAISTVLKWRVDNQRFSEQYAHAREAQADTLADECLDIADDASNDWMERENSDGTKRVEYNGDSVQRSKLRVEQRRWYAGKLAPKRYGERQQVDHTSSDGTMSPGHMDDEQAALQLSKLLSAAQAKLPASSQET